MTHISMRNYGGAHLQICGKVITGGKSAAKHLREHAAKLAGQGVDVQQLHARAAAMDGEPETDQIVGNGRGVVSAEEAARVDCPGCVAAYSRLNGGRALTDAARTR